MKKYLLLGLLFISGLSACTSVKNTDVVVDSTSPPVVSRMDRTIVEKPVVSFSPRNDITQVDVRAKETVATSRSVDMTTPGVLSGPGDYHQNRYSPSIFK